ncbi:MAG: hypothetical protein D6696_17500 [Acidobacteria bacterium]|nr:MAG: hypothetical protein D6696_17500 [Acidobacteriota bacterium]
MLHHRRPLRRRPAPSSRRAVVPLVVLLLALPAPPAAVGEETPPGGRAEDRAPAPYGLHQLRLDLRYMLRRPFELDRRDKRHLALTGALTAGLYLLRDDIRDEVQDSRSDGRERLLQDARLVSRGAVAPGLALAAYLASFATGEAREKETALMLLESAAAAAVISGVGSFVLAAERPEDGDAIRSLRIDGHGVSLDAALAAAIVEPLRCQYLRPRPGSRPAARAGKHAASAVLYLAAALTAFQRLDQDKHWAPDAFLGVAGALAAGRTLCEAHGKRPARRLALAPLAVRGGGGVALRLRLGRSPPAGSPRDPAPRPPSW